MAYFLQQMLNGLTLGAVYALIAMGYTMVYGIVGMINFAHGEIYMIGAFITVIAFAVLGAAGLSNTVLLLGATLVVTMLVTGLYGWTVERVAYRPLRTAPRLAPLISAIGMSVFLQNYVQIFQGARVRSFPSLIEGGVTLMAREDGFVVVLSWLQAGIIALTLLLMGVVTFLVLRTPLGRAQRACEQDPRMAALLGINVNAVISTTFVMGAVLAAIAGFMATLYYGVVDFFMGFLAGMKAFTAAVLGGIGSLPGAILGGFLIGLIEAFWGGYVNAQYRDIVVFAILMLVLIARPNGLLGRASVEKV